MTDEQKLLHKIADDYNPEKLLSALREKYTGCEVDDVFVSRLNDGKIAVRIITKGKRNKTLYFLPRDFAAKFSDNQNHK